ncbi:MAG: hypothetical protein RIQ83_584 [Pseudomonadota bacterium]|jgi:hypothetical protein
MTGHCVVSFGEFKLTLPRANLSPKKALDFLSDKLIEFELLVVDGETAPSTWIGR